MTGWALVALVGIVIWGIVQIYTRRNDGALGVTRDEDGNPVFPPARHDDRDPGETREMRREIENLRERIRVLERIATDSNSLDARETRRLSAEIDALRTEGEKHDKD
jgi:hypothetical protein